MPVRYLLTESLNHYPDLLSLIHKKFQTKLHQLAFIIFVRFFFSKSPNNLTNLSDVTWIQQILLHLSYKVKFLVVLAFSLIYYFVKVETITFIVILICKYLVIKFVLILAFSEKFLPPHISLPKWQ